MSELPRTAGLVVVGAGAVGAAAAWRLARDGHEVLLVDRGQVGMGASAGTACLVTPSHSERMANPSALLEGLAALPDPTGPLSLRPTPRLVPWLARYTAASLRVRAARAGTELLRRMSRESLALHHDWHRELGTGLEQRGLLNCYLTDAGLRRRDELAAEHRAAGLEVELVDRAGALELEPALRGVRGGAYYPEEAHLDSLRFTQRVADAAREEGVRVAEGVEVLRLDPRPGPLTLHTTAGTVTTPRVVLATGVWSGRLARDVGAVVPLHPAKGYHVELSDRPVPIRRPVFLAETRVVATPLPGRLRLAGTLELGTDPDAVDHRRVEAIERAGTRHLAGLDGARRTAVWRGARPMTSDGMPVVGRAPGDDRVLLAVGHGMLGITLAPHTAEQLVRLARGERLPDSAAALRPERFAGVGLSRGGRGRRRAGAPPRS